MIQRSVIAATCLLLALVALACLSTDPLECLLGMLRSATTRGRLRPAGSRAPPRERQRGADYADWRITSQLDQILSTCPSLSYSSCKDLDKRGWTSAARTSTCCLTLGHASHWSSFQLQTYDNTGSRLVAGGDYWVISLRHEESGVTIPTRVFDEGNGTYLVMFVPPLPGTYTVDAWLHYTRCLGFQNMPEVPGQAERNYTGELVSQDDWCFLGHHVRLPPVEITPAPAGAAGADTAAAAAAAAAAGPGQVPKGGPRTGPSPAAAATAGRKGERGNVGTPSAQQQVFRLQDRLYLQGGQLQWLESSADAGAASGAEQRAAGPVFPGWQTARGSDRIIVVGDSTVIYPFMVMSMAQAAPCVMLASDHHRYRYRELQLGREGECLRIEGGLGLEPPPDFVTFQPYKPFASCRPPANPSGPPNFTMTACSQYVKENNKIPRTGELLQQLEIYQEPAAPLDATGRAQRIHYAYGKGCRIPKSLWDMTLRHIQPNDTLVINMGLHCVYKATFSVWRQIVDELAPMLRSLPTKNVFWRTSPTVMEHVFKRGVYLDDSWVNLGQAGLYKPEYHFLNSPRRLLFDLYAEAAMRAHGIRVVDIHGFPVDYLDPTHYDMLGYDLHNQMLSQVVC